MERFNLFKIAIKLTIFRTFYKQTQAIMGGDPVQSMSGDSGWHFQPLAKAVSGVFKGK